MRDDRSEQSERYAHSSPSDGDEDAVEVPFERVQDPRRLDPARAGQADDDDVRGVVHVRAPRQVDPRVGDVVRREDEDLRVQCGAVDAPTSSGARIRARSRPRGVAEQLVADLPAPGGDVVLGLRVARPSSSTEPICTVPIAFFVSSSGPGQAAPRASTTFVGGDAGEVGLAESLRSSCRSPPQ